MPRYDPDVIAALAEGRMDPDEAAALEREIAADPIASAELEAHRTALAFMQEFEAPTLSEDERTDLHSTIAAAIGISQPAPATTDTPRRVPWTSLGIAAAALAGLVAVVPVVGLLSTGGSDDASFDLAAEAPTTTESVAAEARVADEVLEQSALGAAAENDGLTAGDDAADTATFGSSTTLRATTTTQATETAAAEAPTATTTTAAPAETTTTVAESSATTEPLGLEELSQDLASLRGEGLDAVEQLGPVAAEEGSSCWIEDTGIRADPPPERFMFQYENGELTVVVYYELQNGELSPFQVWGVPDCAELVVVGE